MPFSSFQVLRVLTNLLQCKKVVRSYKDGVYVHSSNFSAKSCNTWARQYNKNFDNRMDEWWMTILACYNAAAFESDCEESDESIDEMHDTLPRSSP